MALQKVYLTRSALLLILLFGFLAGCVDIPNPGPISPIENLQGKLQIHYIDVGQGDATLIISPEGNTALIDSGAPGSGAVEYLLNLGITQLDIVIATHPDNDHIGAMDEVLAAFPVERVVTNGQAHTTQAYERFLEAIEESQAEYVEAKRGDQLALGGLIFNVLHPSESHLNGEELNNVSLVLRLVFGETSFLFTGDAEKEAEEDILLSGTSVQADILKLGHHGSHSSTTPEFLIAVRPSVAIYSAGKDNPYGHPHQDTLALLAGVGIKIYGTDEYGTIVITSDGSTYEIQVEKGSQ